MQTYALNQVSVSAQPRIPPDLKLSNDLVLNLKVAQLVIQCSPHTHQHN